MMPTRRRRRSIAARTAGMRAHRRARRRNPLAVHRPAVRRRPAPVPRVQLVLTPPTPNLDIPNEDARSVDLEDSNLFALNRFPGYDRWEDGRESPTASTGRSIARTCRSTAPSAKATGSLADPAFSLKERALTTAFPISSDEPGSATAASSTHSPVPDRQGQFCVRRNEVDLTVGTTRPTLRSAI